MLDLSHLPQTGTAQQQIFYATTPTSGTSWQTWLKPRGISFVQFFVLGGGGGGGGARGESADTGSGGGAGGGSSAQCSFVFPAWAIPDVLYVSVGAGGGGGTPSTGAVAGGNGGSGQNSYITIYPATTVNYIMCQANGGTGGNGASSATNGGGAVAGGTVTAIASAPLAGLGFPAWGHAATNISLAGQNSGAGGNAGNSGGAITLAVTGLVVHAGTGGAGRTSAASQGGGAFNLPSGAAGDVFPPHPIGTAGIGGAGSNGYQAIPKLLLFYPGTGGGGGTGAIAGGLGGAGGYGCGGGGGGAGFPGGAGGRGGNGLVIATAW